jgi:DNA-binding PadR family transcriptional regulator
MFHWHKGNLYVVLSNREEDELLRLVSDGARDRALYLLSRKDRKRLESRMFSHLDRLLKADPHEFHRRYVDRSGTGPEAVEQLELLLEGYSRVVHRAFWENADRRRSIPDDLPLTSSLTGITDACHIVIMKPIWWDRLPVRKLARLTVPVDSIERVVGRSDHFHLVTKFVHVEFSPRWRRDHRALAALTVFPRRKFASRDSGAGAHVRRPLLLNSCSPRWETDS